MTNKTKKQMNKAQMKNTKGGALAIYGIRRYWAGSKDGGLRSDRTALGSVRRQYIEGTPHSIP